ncbi:hypothetical protein J7X22_004667 [Vibrio parahaemolyticus]|nr:hypothetical protein [Vibrio parahaemolyticus]
MEYKWNVFATVVVALISGGVGAYTANANSESILELEKLKLEEKKYNDRIAFFNKRCDAISALHRGMADGVQNLYISGSSEDFQETVQRLAKLRSQRQEAETYLGEVALAHKAQIEKALEASEEKKPEFVVIPTVSALREELKLCNSADAFTENT